MDLLSTITDFANAQASGDVQMRVFECSMEMALSFLSDNPEAKARIAMAAIEAATDEDEEVEVQACGVLSHLAEQLESFSTEIEQKEDDVPFSVGDPCFIVGIEKIKEAVVNRGQDSDGYYLIDLGDEQIIPALGLGMFRNLNDCIDQQVLVLRKKIDNINAQRINQ